MRRARLPMPLLAGGLCLFAACRVPRSQPPPPHAVFQDTSHDLGSVARGAPLRHEFLVRNAGGGLLRIDRLRVAADCQARASGETMAAGASSSVRIECDSRRQSGRWQRSLTMYTNDPRQPVQGLTLTAAVHSEIEVRPTVLYAGSVQPGDTLRQEILVRGRLPRAGGLRSRGGIEASWHPAGDGLSGRIRVRIQTGVAQGPLQAVVQIGDLDPNQGWTIPVVGFVTPASS